MLMIQMETELFSLVTIHHFKLWDKKVVMT